MIIDINVEANSSEIEVFVPQAQLSWSLADIVAYDVSSDVLISYGESEDEIERQFLKGRNREVWENLKPQLGFLVPFAPETFHPKYAAKVIWHHKLKTRRAMNRGIVSLFDRYNYRLNISQYEDVPCNKREDFAYLLYKHLKPRLLVINDEAFDSRPYRMSELSLRLLYWVAILFVLAITFIFRLSVAKVSLNWWQIVLLGVIYISISVGLVYGFPLLWATVMRNFLPSHALEVLLPTLRLPKQVRDKLNAMLQRT